MALIIITALFLILSVWVFSFVFKSSVINPTSFFFFVWFLCFILYSLNLYPDLYVIELSFYAKRLFVESFVAVFVGSVCCDYFLRSSFKKSDSNLYSFEDQIDIFLNITKALLCFFILIVLLLFVAIYMHYGKCYVAPSLIKNDIIGLNVFKLPLYIKLFKNLGIVLIFNATILLLFSYKRFKFILLTLAIGFLWLYLDFTLGSWMAGYIVFFCVFILLLYSYKGQGVRSWLKYSCKISSVLLSFFTFLLLVMYQRGAYLGFNDKIETSLAIKHSAFKHLYVYATGNIPSFSYVVDNPFPTEFFGHYTFAFVYRPLNYLTRNIAGIDFAGSTWDYYQTYVRIFENINTPFNSSPYLGFIYSDFGEVGVIVYSLLMGAVFTFIYRNFIVRRRIVDFQILLFIMVQIPLMLRSAPYSAIEFWVQVSLILLQHLFLCWKYPRLAQARLDFILPSKAVS